MKRLLEERFFPYVVKPGRYAGGEPGSLVKAHEGRLRYLLAFPDKYEIGHSYLGLQTLYHVVNQDDRFVGERVFAPDRDAEEIMRKHGIPLFSLESRTPAAAFDAIGFTLSYELVYTTVLQMIDLAGLPLRAAERTDEQPLILAGGPAAYNPEPMAPFVDLFFIGDGEEGLPQMLAILHQMRGATRAEKLARLVREVESVYVPRFYDDRRRPLVDFAPAEIAARVVPALKPSYYPPQPVVPLIETVHQHLSVEIMRGCPRGCRFCEAGTIYKPVRLRPPHEILAQVETQERHVGADSVSLLSLSTSDYPDIDDLARKVARLLEPMRAAVSVPSLRPGSITPELLDTLKLVRKAGLTIAPEAGTERLRAFIRKDIPDAAVYDSAEIAFSKGVTTLKLYFMIGLPTETEEDLLAIARMIERVFDLSRNYPGKRTVNVTLSPFVAEPHTAFQWDATATPAEIDEKLKFIKRHVRSRHVNFKHGSAEEAVLKALLSRGGREMADVIEAVYRAGGRFDGWAEDFNPQRWFDLCRSRGIEIEERLRSVPFSADLPWSHIRKGPSLAHLQEERHRTSTQLREYVPRFRGETAAPLPEPELQFGRGKKKVATRATAAPTRNRLRPTPTPESSLPS
ncbi:MAG TPA: TIGR03960 family B12-binding radical SAM protein, partial [candidate division Zixibacteria bacterium]|nr:TIGR03960 family B12-binding radical SAM protein [candidate division Zixibacteria bacterium]